MWEIPDRVDLRYRRICAQAPVAPRTFKHDFNHISFHRM